jgi:hypothetical protein
MSEKQVLTAWQRLTQLRNEIKVNKSIKNDFGNFMYRNLEQIQEALKPLEVKYNLAFPYTTQVVVDPNGVRMIEATVFLIDTLTGDKVFEVKASADIQKEAGTKMNVSQLSGSATSYAVKYAINGLLGLDDTKDADDELLTDTESNVKKEEKVLTVPATKSGSNVVTTTPPFLMQLRDATLKAQSVEDINSLLAQCDTFTPSNKEEENQQKITKQVIHAKARQLGYVPNTKTKQYEQA